MRGTIRKEETSMFELTIAAATAETVSKFRLAEALALDIPPRHRGPSDEEPLVTYLAQVAEAIEAAGGEPRAVDTLREYRVTALWVCGDFPTNFAWVPGASFSAHNEARSAGKDRDWLAALPDKRIDAVRQAAGHQPKSGSLSRLPGMTPAQQAEVAAAALSMLDPVERAEIIEDAADTLPPEEKHAVAAALVAPKPLPPIPPHAPVEFMQPGEQEAQEDAERRVLDNRADLAKVVQLLKQVHARGDDLDNQARSILSQDLAKVATWLDVVTKMVTGKSLDEELADLLSGDVQ
jgi:hypothetical protein